MPNYDYLCGDCGSFTAFKPIALYQEPEPCPGCAIPAPRVIMNAPAVSGASRPDAGGGARPAWLDGMRKHAGGCACC